MIRPRGFPLCHHFFFYGWLFRDASVGTFSERAAALAHNKEQSRSLPTYLRRWLLLASLLLAMAAFCEDVLTSATLSASFCVLATVAIAFNTITAACWALLRSGR
jgi:hypothetical protein